MGFTPRQWLTSFFLDALLKSVSIGFVGMAITSTSPFQFIWPAVFLSIFHFVCLFLGFTAAAAFEWVGMRFTPTPKFWLGLLFANVLFGAAVNAWLASVVMPPKSFLELSPVTTPLVVTNLIPIFLVLASSCLFRRIRRSCASRRTRLSR